MEYEEEAIRESLRALTQFFVNDGTLGDTLLRVSEMACAITPAKYAGITLLVEGAPRTGIFTHPDSPEIDEAQYRSGEGPCMDAFRDQETSRIDDTASETRSVPLAARTAGIGALNLYAEHPGAFTDAHEKAVLIFAEQASIALANAQVYWDARELSENLSEAIKTREVISQAVGILMAGGGRTPDDAFKTLSSASQRENRKVRDIAADIVVRTVQRGSKGTTAG
jgi:GAF domain-containing protein